MKKAAFFLVFILLPTLLLAQSTITVVSNIKVTYDKDRGSYRWYRPVFAHEGSTLAADSSDFTEGDNFFDAYGHVVITQPNGTVVYADKLHYTEETQQALLTGNVRLVDQGSTLTTDYLTYNMKSKIGTYHGGGRIINGTDTLDSKGGYYFESSQDAYFRKDVIVRTPDALIKTDTMRYNSGSKVTYFYGPTNIFGKNGTLYTENGDYNTETDRARFGKNNLYTEGSKFLRGDSLYYDGKSGNGRAVKNVVFVDTAQQIVMRGQLGTYTKATQTTIVTKNAYIVLAADEAKEKSKDSTLTRIDSLKPIEGTTPGSGTPDSLAVKPLVDKPEAKKDSTFMTADTLFSQVIPLKDYLYLNIKLGQENDVLEEESEESEQSEEGNNQIISRDAPGSEGIDSISANASDSLSKKHSLGLKTDSLKSPTDSLKKDTLLSPDDLKKAQADSLKKAKEQEKVKKKELKKQEKLAKKKAKEDLKAAKREKEQKLDSLKALDKAQSPKDSLLAKGIDSLKKDSLTNKPLALDSSLTDIPHGTGDSLLHAATQIALKAKTDSLRADTGETRIVKAYHNVKIFKSDFQAIADSAYYGYADSVIRCFGKPIIWSQGSQLSADTVYMILKNQKMENVLFDKNAFIVNTQLDSTKFNQIKGRKITGYFDNNELNRVYVDGNAESVYYTVEDNKYSGMVRSVSSRIKIKFENKEMTDVISIRKPESTYYPIASIAADKEILEGFIWKPELRPTSKEEIIAGTPIRRSSTPTDEVLNTKEVAPIETKDKDSKVQETEVEEGEKQKEKIPEEKTDEETKAESSSNSSKVVSTNPKTETPTNEEKPSNTKSEESSKDKEEPWNAKQEESSKNKEEKPLKAEVKN